MNPGIIITVGVFCVLPLLMFGLGVTAGIRYAHYGWQGLKISMPDWSGNVKRLDLAD